MADLVKDLLESQLVAETVRHVAERGEPWAEIPEAGEIFDALVASSLAMAVLDAEGRVLSWNESAERLFGWAESEVKGEPLPLVTDAGRSEHLALRERVLGGEVITRAVTRRWRKDGTPVDVRLTAVPLRDGAATPKGLLISYVVVSGRKRVELELHASEERLRLHNRVLLRLARRGWAYRGELEVGLLEITEAVGDTLEVDLAGIWLLDEDRVTLRCADVYEREDARHSRGYDLRTDDLPVFMRAVESERILAVSDVRADRRVEEFVEPHFGPLGVVSVLKVPIRVSGRLAGVLSLEHAGALRDWAADEQSFAGSIADLVALTIEAAERRRAEREREELKEQLRQAQKMEAVGRLAGGIAHDFNNLLTAIRGHAEIVLQDLGAAEPVYPDVQEIERAAGRAAALTRQLLAFSRRQVLQPEILDLNDVVREMERLFRRLIGEDVELVSTLSPDLGRIKVDRGQIEQVLLNLAVNARDAMPEGGRLMVETRNVVLSPAYARTHMGVRPGSYIMLVVTDTGTGMSEDTLAHVFEPFFTTKETGKGTGLGLSTVYGIVKQSGGNVWVYSEMGRGTSFKIYLPRVADGEPADARAWAAPEGDSAASTGTETVLVVEDEPAVRALLRKILSRGGYTVLEATGGREALELARSHPTTIHLVVTDVIMPDMGGPELAERLAAENAGMKVLFMSGYTERAVVHHGVLEEGVHFLEKPFSPAELTRYVRRVLDEPSG